MATRTPSWGLGVGHAYEPIRCLVCLGFDITCWDLLRLLPCIVWTCLAVASAGLFIEYPVVNSRTPHLLPMLGAIQSAMPSFMCAALLLMYHRQRVRLFGLPRETAAALGGFYCIVSSVGCLVFLALLMTTVFVFQVDRAEDPSYFFLSSTWLLVTLLWFILQSCLKPSAKQIERLVQRFEASQPSLSLSSSPFPSGAVGVVVGAPVAGAEATGEGARSLGGGPAGGAETELAGLGKHADPVVVGQVRT